jgi:hypothetical protein
MVVADPIGLNGTTIPFKMTVGNLLVRIVGRANTAQRPMTISAKWQGKSMSSQGFYAVAPTPLPFRSPRPIWIPSTASRYRQKPICRTGTMACRRFSD